LKVQVNRHHASQKRLPPVHKHLRNLDYLPYIRRILPSTESVPSLHYSFRIDDAPLYPDDMEREEYEK